MKSLKSRLKECLKNKLIIDIFIIGSYTKDKIEAKDIDLIVLFRERDYKKIEDIIYDIKQNLEIENLHIEPLIVDNFLKESIFSTVIHEGISIKHNKTISELIRYKSFVLFTFSLKKLKNIEKVRFAQAIYGRKGEGILKEEGGIILGKGAFFAPISKEHIFRDIMAKFKVNYDTRRVLVKD